MSDNKTSGSEEQESFYQPSLETGEGCFDFLYDFSRFVNDEAP